MNSKIKRHIQKWFAWVRFVAECNSFYKQLLKIGYFIFSATRRRQSNYERRIHWICTLYWKSVHDGWSISDNVSLWRVLTRIEIDFQNNIWFSWQLELERDLFFKISSVSTNIQLHVSIISGWNFSPLVNESGFFVNANRILATNNSRKYNGTTYLEAEDPHVQLIHVEDGNQLDATYQIVFTPDELNSKDEFCRGITNIVARKYHNTHSSNDLWFWFLVLFHTYREWSAWCTADIKYWPKCIEIVSRLIQTDAIKFHAGDRFDTDFSWFFFYKELSNLKSI